MDPWYVTGFCEGQASFTYSRSNGNLALYFAIKLGGTDDSILHGIRSFFGDIGAIYQVMPRVSSARAGFAKGALYFRVSKASQLIRIVEHFERYPLRGSKSASFATWREMVTLKQIFRKPPRNELEKLARQLSDRNPRNQLGDVGQSKTHN